MMPYKVTKEDLQEYGTMFGGRLLYILDKTLHRIVSQTCAGEKIVTTSIQYEFLEEIKEGDEIDVYTTINYQRSKIRVDFHVSTGKKQYGWGSVTFKRL